MPSGRVRLIHSVQSAVAVYRERATGILRLDFDDSLARAIEIAVTAIERRARVEQSRCAVSSSAHNHAQTWRPATLQQPLHRQTR
jgi:hypothetical protein